jgi:flagellar biosynthesis protein FlhB
MNLQYIKAKNIIDINWKRLMYFGLSGVKSFFSAVTQVAWGIASIFILGAVLRYMMEKYSTGVPDYVSETFLSLTVFIIDNIMWFVFIFWLFYWITDYKELKK